MDGITKTLVASQLLKINLEAKKRTQL